MEPLVDNNSLYTYGTCILPNSAAELKQIIEQCNSEIRGLETQFFDEEYKDTSKDLLLLNNSSITY